MKNSGRCKGLLVVCGGNSGNGKGVGNKGVDVLKQFLRMILDERCITPVGTSVPRILRFIEDRYKHT